MDRSILHLASDEISFPLLVIDYFLQNLPKRECRSFQTILSEWLQAGLNGENDLLTWIKEKAPQLSGNRRVHTSSGSFDAARRAAEQRQRQGIKVLLLRHGIAPGGSHFVCPKVLFATGDIAFQDVHVALFNSRKPLQVHPDDRWLRVLRHALSETCSQGASFISSNGTFTYDLVSTYAKEHASKLLLVLPQPIELALAVASLDGEFGPMHGRSIITCTTVAVRTPGKAAMVCRDRLIASFADLHWIIEIRSRGNLWSVLDRQQTTCPKPQWVFVPGKRNHQAEGNFQLLEKYPQWGSPVVENELRLPAARLSRPTTCSLAGVSAPDEIVWTDFLLHYTRACPGPWPGQDKADHLMQLLAGECSSAHTALDTLIRILTENKIRASLKLIRGTRAVVSWSRRMPDELASIRRWNRALIRWTFEPYGIAVKREILFKQGARPVIYAPNSIYARLRTSERFRFQLHEPPRCSWKAEREWRLPGDFSLSELSFEDSFVFVPKVADVEEIRRHTDCPLRVVALEKLPGG